MDSEFCRDCKLIKEMDSGYIYKKITIMDRFVELVVDILYKILVRKELQDNRYERR